MVVALSKKLISDPVFCDLIPLYRLFYIILASYILETKEEGGDVDYDGIISSSGLSLAQATNAINKLQTVGFVERKKKEIVLLKVDEHFHIFIPPKTKKTRPPPRTKDVMTVFSYWQKIHKRVDPNRITDKRKDMLRARLSDGLTVQDLMTATDGCKVSTYHQGDNDRGIKYDSLETIYRSVERVEKFITYKREYDELEEKNREQREIKENADSSVMSRAELLRETRDQDDYED